VISNPSPPTIPGSSWMRAFQNAGSGKHFLVDEKGCTENKLFEI
jgi:hypothetical protein